MGCGFCLAPLTWPLWGKPAAMSWGHSNSSVEGDWGLLPATSTNRPDMWAIVEATQAFGWLKFLPTFWLQTDSDHPAKPQPDFWPTESMWDDKLYDFGPLSYIATQQQVTTTWTGDAEGSPRPMWLGYRAQGKHGTKCSQWRRQPRSP